MVSPDDLPSGYELFSRKVDKKGDQDADILKQIGTNRIIKLTKDQFKETCEEKFYRLIKGNLDVQYEILISDEDCQWPYANLEDLDTMATFTPDYFGVENISGKKFLILEDVTFQYKYPAFMVLNMAPNPSTGEREENTRAGRFDLTGWKIIGKNGTTEQPAVTNDEKVQVALKEFLIVARKQSVEEIVQELMRKMLEMKMFFEKQTSFHFRGSSLIFLYEVDSTRPVDCRVYMTGFSDVLPGYSEKDEGYLLALNKIIRLLESVQDL